MPKYDFKKFNGHEFESLIRTLCYEVLGKGGVSFPMGADGGRDFAISGKMAAYSERDWDGYVVVQAKYKASLDGGQKDIDWLKAKLDGELAAYKDQQKGREKPEYYIISTNVDLSGADRKDTKGGFTKISDHLEKWKKEIGIKDFDIWHADKLFGYLESQTEIRQSYTSWITPSDILSKIFSNMEDDANDLETAIKCHLRFSIKQDQYVKLRDTGNVEEKVHTKTSQVFIDLPLDLESNFHQEKLNCIAHVADFSRNKLDPNSISEFKKGIEFFERPLVNRVVILGGPGQGKSTTGMFLVQVLRAVALKSESNLQHDRQLAQLVDEILERAVDEGISINLPYRIPFHVDLPKFADYLSKNRSNGDIPSLTDFIAVEVNRSSVAKATSKQIRDLIKSNPWLIVLDGLDEVPSTGERAAVLASIEQLSNYLNECWADTLLIVTSRPQSYNDDLPKENWTHWELKDLDKKTALRYLNALAVSQYPYDKDRRERIIQRLQRATEQPATGNLMLSPLQNCIMFMITDIGGSVPTDRWTLFSEYFEILKRREKAKEGPVGEVIESNLKHIFKIHERVGLILQAISETSGAASSFLTTAQFELLLRNYLVSEGVEGTKLETKVKELTEVALDRLVLLSAKVEGQISFDVRSLQEYMAASALMAGPENCVAERLLHIADKAHWRNAFLIAASRYFADGGMEHFRDVIVGIPRKLEVDDRYRLINYGSTLATSMFLDGIGLEADKYRRMLAKHSLERVQYCNTSEVKVIKRLLEPETESVFYEALLSAIDSEDQQSNLVAWLSYFAILGDGEIVWDMRFQQRWEKLVETKKFEILSKSDSFRSIRLSEEIQQLIITNPILVVKEKLTHHFHNNLWSHGSKALTARGMHSISVLEVFSRRSEATDDPDIQFLSSYFQNDDFRLTIRKLEDSFSIPEEVEIEKWHDSWAIISYVNDLSSNLTDEGLVKFLDLLIAKNLLRELHSISTNVSWLVRHIIDTCLSIEHLKGFRDDFIAGKLGSMNDFIAAENRWLESGVTSKDFEYSLNEASFLHSKISTVGSAPLRGWSITLNEQMPHSFLKLWKHMQPYPDTVVKRQVTRIICGDGGPIYEDSVFSKEDSLHLLELLEYSESFDYRLRRCPHPVLTYLSDTIWEDESVVFRVHKLLKTTKFQRELTSQQLSINCVRAYAKFPACYRVLGLAISSFPEKADSGALFKGVIISEIGGTNGVSSNVKTLRLCVALMKYADDLENLRSYFKEIEEQLNDATARAKILSVVRDHLSKTNVVIEITEFIIAYCKTKVIPIDEFLTNKYLGALNTIKTEFTEENNWKHKYLLPPESYDLLNLGIRDAE